MVHNPLSRVIPLPNGLYGLWLGVGPPSGPLKRYQVSSNNHKLSNLPTQVQGPHESWRCRPLLCLVETPVSFGVVFWIPKGLEGFRFSCPWVEKMRKKPWNFHLIGKRSDFNPESYDFLLNPFRENVAKNHAGRVAFGFFFWDFLGNCSVFIDPGNFSMLKRRGFGRFPEIR